MLLFEVVRPFSYRGVTYPAIWRWHHISRERCGVSYGRCRCECGECASLKETIHLQWEKTASLERDAASPAGDAVSPEGDLLASPNFGMCDTTPFLCVQFSLTSPCRICLCGLYEWLLTKKDLRINSNRHSLSFGILYTSRDIILSWIN
jgi:hypothetical protein